MSAPRTHIPQPPHTAGERYKGLRQRIDPAQIPSPIDNQARDAAERTTPFLTLPGSGRPPLATTADAVCIDQGNAAPRFVRPTTWSLPNCARLARECHIPLAAHFQPFAEQPAGEEPVPLVAPAPDSSGPPRCARCRAYVNPWCPWLDGGNAWRCNLCKHHTPTDPAYFCLLDPNGMRLDHQQRPELCRGAVDFEVGREYWAKGAPRLSKEHPGLPPVREPQPLTYVFALDVSREAVQSGFLRASCEALRGVLFGATSSALPPAFPPNSRLCLLTFDRAVHFYDLRPDPLTGLPPSPPPTVIMADVEDVFLPFREGLFVRPDECRDTLLTLLTTLPDRFEGTTTGENAMGSAVVAGLAGLAPTGGHLVVFQAGLPGVGMGALSGTPNEQEAWANEKEYTLHRPSSPFWPRLAERCVQCGVGVSLFLAPGRPVGVASVATLPNLTGGDIFFHPRFEYAVDAPILSSEVRRLVGRKTVYDAVVRVRCSEGLHITAHQGAFTQTSPTDLEFGVMSADTAFGATIGFTGGPLAPTVLDVREFAHIQCAVLYTTAEGSRRVRVLNLALQAVELAANVFHYADMEAVLAHVARGAMTKLPSEPLSAIRDEITEQCALMHLGYRERCAQAAGVGQLIIPETLKGLLAHTLGLLKTKPLKSRVAVAADVRVYAAHKLLAGGVKEIVRRCYPRVMAVHDLEEGACLAKEGEIVWPTLMRASHMFMEAHGVYLADNEELQILWVGASASPQLLLDLFGVDDIFAVDPRMVRPTLPALPTLLSRQVHAIIARRAHERGGRTLKFAIARQNLDGAEVEFADMLVEDENNGSMAYLDCECFFPCFSLLLFWWE
ncbi:vWA-like protein [Schizophyllum commune H4-8]|uniref:vWA-like protein n=1 Tax=Schizophyllum commune (strain H4-8 / FGSC 9210) TaxID=578458 RepID=UPI002160E113|nr:vWA-like protein [Schizophyllum commune H4-8]KAI5888444.1 vWA-like protein [Schizophyllum commune H4-8]